MRSRIAIFEGHKSPFGSRRMAAPPQQRTYTTIPSAMDGYGAPLFNNPRMQYYVPPGYIEIPGQAKRKRKGYKVKETRSVKKNHSRFKKAAKMCSRKSRNKRKGAYQACMRKALKKKSRR